eukprot:g3497.t1
MEEQNTNSESSGAAPQPLPILAPGQFYNDAGFGAVNPQMLFGGSQGNSGPDYLSYKPRSAMERMVYNTGILYLGGIGLGGVYGTLKGMRSSPSRRLKIRINSVLNKMATHSSKTGNALGVLAIMYSSFEAGSDYLEIDKMVGTDMASPFIAAVCTGMLYKSTLGAR